ncbi:hypothetical protein K3175_05350 [Qipengyuania sp. GH1]|uniref:hypothetical protein n=1 Tax=Qipengyuania aestuarii TaxID=2867241 RepID=UPI001C8738C2|nr:hypothetical protein [Qipengyuania aestuarii]MBX7535080.1 hypothetical protein [Qipengyuania aestuarii]
MAISQRCAVYLPLRAQWVDASNGQSLEGGQTIVAKAPLERMPLFVRASSIVPSGPAIPSTAQDTGGELTVHVFGGSDGSFTLYEDEGITRMKGPTCVMKEASSPVFQWHGTRLAEF